MPERRKRPVRYTAQMVIMEEPEIAGRIRAWAEVRKVDVAPLVRDALRAGLEALEPTFILEAGGCELDADFLAAHVADSVKARRSTQA